MNQKAGTVYYPIFLNVKDKRCVVVGGGQVALRKVNILLEHGADVFAISPEICTGLEELVGSGEICALVREYRPGDLKEAFVAIAATDNNEINLQVVAEARRKSVIVNVVDDADNSDFIVPSRLRRGDITVAVSTGGKSPALARKIRTRLEREFCEEYAALAELIGEVREETIRQKMIIDGDGWQEALDLDQLLDLLKEGKRNEAKAALRSNLEAQQR